MNNSYYENTDENFNQALNFYQMNYFHSQLLELLKSGNIVQKQIAALRFDNIKSYEDAQVFLDNLTGQDGKIREAVSMRLAEFMADKNQLKYFCCDKNYQIFLDAITDINGNICRNTINAISNLLDDWVFCVNFCGGLVNLTKELLIIVEKFDNQDGKYKVNKEAFKLYWCLETIYVFYDKIEKSELKFILTKASKIADYTIREKAAKILTKSFDDNELNAIKNMLKNDSNYYVRRF